MTRDYKETLFLPTTSFSLQGTKDENMVRSSFDYSPTVNPDFVLHDGPPYANGDIHMGHALNKILKDMVVQSQRGLGKSVEYRPGWDCHGLPIESQVEKELLEQGIAKNDLSVMDFRSRCREYAMSWVETQKKQFQSLGVRADWDNPYLTMNFKTEATIVSKFHSMLMRNCVYRGTKPVQWSTVEQTALAEAEVDYKNLKTRSVYVAYTIGTDTEWMQNTRVLIWTTTPWTLPASAAVAFNPDLEYGIYEVVEVDNEAKCKPGDRFILADARAEAVMTDIHVDRYTWLGATDPRFLVVRHPLYKENEAFVAGIPLLPGKHVTDEAGTGLVHTAPDHGQEDFACWNASNQGEYPVAIGPDGVYLDWVPYFAGLNVLNQTPKGEYIFEFTNAKIIKALEDAGNLVGVNNLVHSYPHSWRSKAPLVYRVTPQWFLRLKDTRELAVKLLDNVKFYPESSKNRLVASVENRPDWLLSRQRVWGTPMAVFLNNVSGDVLHCWELNDKIAKVFAEEGGDAWWKYSTSEWFAGIDAISHLDPNHYEKVNDVLDVWFDSGCSFHFIDKKPDLCIEGSDQHRGWYGSALFVGLNHNVKAPWKALMTHGFVLDKNGIKMSKSAGNVVNPLVEAKKYGTDVIRMWAAMSDYTQDMRVGDQILKTTSEQYRKLRNTLRYLVSNLQGYEFGKFKSEFDFPLETHVLYLLESLEEKIRLAYSEYRFNDVMRDIMQFCNNDLSAFYFDIRKDMLYCDAETSENRQACLETLSRVFDCLTSWLMPILPFAATEARQLVGRPVDSVFAMAPNVSPWEYANEKQWAVVRSTIKNVNEALEEKRKAKEIGGALEANVLVFLPKDDFAEFCDGVDLRNQAVDFFRTSQATIFESVDDSVKVEVYKAQGNKCARSWKILTEVGTDSAYPDLSLRDAEAVRQWDLKNGSL
jgi:isoleucyl-tRNA synthetase